MGIRMHLDCLEEAKRNRTCTVKPSECYTEGGSYLEPFNPAERTSSLTGQTSETHSSPRREGSFHR